METKRCKGPCGLIKPLDEFYRSKHTKDGHAGTCVICRKLRAAAWRAANLEHAREQDREKSRRWMYKHGGNLPMSQSKRCSSYLGVYIAERVLSGFFDHIEKMPYGFPGYDFVCGKGFKIDVKSSCLIARKNGSHQWGFTIKRNKVPDYFLCIGFDNRKSLTPLHVWLIPGNLLNENVTFNVSDLSMALDKWTEYEKPLDRVLTCCNVLRGEATP